MPIQIKNPYQFLAEGRDTQIFLANFLNHLGIATVDIHDFGGKDNLGKFLTGFIRIPGFEKVKQIAIIRDADDDCKSALRSVASHLASADRNKDFTSLCSVFALPDNSSAGVLETLCLNAVAHEPVMECVQQFIMCAKSHGITIHEHKAALNTYLSTTGDPSLKVGEATKAGIWPLHHAAFDSLRQFCLDVTAR